MGIYEYHFVLERYSTRDLYFTIGTVAFVFTFWYFIILFDCKFIYKYIMDYNGFKYKSNGKKNGVW